MKKKLKPKMYYKINCLQQSIYMYVQAGYVCTSIFLNIHNYIISEFYQCGHRMYLAIPSLSLK